MAVMEAMAKSETAHTEDGARTAPRGMQSAKTRR